MLRLYFMERPEVLFDGERFDGTEDWAEEYLEQWEMRQTFWTHHPTDGEITAEDVEESGVDIRGIQRDIEHNQGRPDHWHLTTR